METIPGTLVKFEMIAVPAGTAVVTGPGKPGARRQVTLKPFRIGKTEVTWDEYDVYAFRLDLPEGQRAAARSPGGSGVDAVSRPSRPYGAPDRGFGHQGYPAISLTFHAAEQYCRWLSEKTGKKYRLPTEAEWEYACRAGVEMQTAGARLALDQHAWHWENAEDRTHPVAQKAPNAWGLYDMLGNAGEWCQGLDSKPVLRGGTYDDSAEKVHCGARAMQTPEWNITDPQNPKSQWWLTDGPFAGFRIVREE
jgi:formylglycine-generating enzyme required for sulfatase activity